MTIILFAISCSAPFMDQIAILVLTVPIVLPLIKIAGQSIPLRFGVIRSSPPDVGHDHAVRSD